MNLGIGAASCPLVPSFESNYLPSYMERLVIITRSIIVTSFWTHNHSNLILYQDFDSQNLHVSHIILFSSLSAIFLRGNVNTLYNLPLTSLKIGVATPDKFQSELDTSSSNSYTVDLYFCLPCFSRSSSILHFFPVTFFTLTSIIFLHCFLSLPLLVTSASLLP